MISLKTIKLAVVFSLSVSTAASAISLGFDFVDDVDVVTLIPTDSAGVVPQRNWNSLFSQTGTDQSGNAYDNNGTAVNSTATISWAGNNTWSSTRPGEMNNNFPDPSGDRIMMTGYLDSGDTAATASTVTVNNIDAALRTPAYDVYVYMSNGFNGVRGGGFTLTSGTNTQVKYGSTMVGPTMHVKDPGTDINNTIHGSYLQFTGLTGSSFTLTADASLTMPGGFRATIAGIQIVPAQIFRDGDVDGDGDVDMVDFNAIRDNFQMSVASRSRGDLDEDGFVDFVDFREWKNNFPFPPAGSAASAAIPEPTVWMLIVSAGLVAPWCRQRRS